MRADLDVRHVLLQGLVLRRRPPQCLILHAQRLHLLPQLLHLPLQTLVVLPQLGILLRNAAQSLVLRGSLVLLPPQHLILRLQRLHCGTVLLRGSFDKRHHILTVKPAEHTRLEAGIHGKYLLFPLIAYSIPQIPPADKRTGAKIPPYLKLKRKSSEFRFTNVAYCCILCDNVF